MELEKTEHEQEMGDQSQKTEPEQEMGDQQVEPEKTEQGIDGGKVKKGQNKTKRWDL